MKKNLFFDNSLYQTDQRRADYLIVFDLEMILTHFILEVNCPGYQKTIGPLKFVELFEFRIPDGTLGCEMNTRSFLQNFPGNWFTFAIGVSVIRDLKVDSVSRHSLTFSWKRGPGDLSQLRISYEMAPFPFDLNSCDNMTENSCTLNNGFLTPGEYYEFIVTSYKDENPAVSYLLEVNVPLEFHSNSTNSTFKNGKSIIDLGAGFYGSFKSVIVDISPKLPSLKTKTGE